MRMPAYLAALFLSLFLTACGGGGDPVVSDTSTENDTTGDTGDSADNAIVIGNAEIGVSSGESYQDGVLNITSSNLSISCKNSGCCPMPTGLSK